MDRPNALEIPRGASLGLPTDKDLPSDDGDDDFSALYSMPRGADLPYDDGEPMESPWHRDQMILLIDSIRGHWHDRDDFFVGGNMFLYFSSVQAFDRDFRGPDFFVVKHVDRKRPRVSWVAWEEYGRLPDVIVELISPTTAKIDRVEKKKLYGETFRTAEYFCYDPATDQLEGWRFEGSKGYVPIPVEPDGRMLSQQLDLCLGHWDGTYLDSEARYLRFFTCNGVVVPTFQEAEAAARTAVEAENASLKAQLDALRQQIPPTAP